MSPRTSAHALSLVLATLAPTLACDAGRAAPAPAATVAAATASGVATTATASVGKLAPDFELPDTDGKATKLSSFRGKRVVLEWFNPGCPFVKASHEKGSLRDTAAKVTADGKTVWLGVDSSAPGKQGSDPAEVVKRKGDWKLSHPVLLDPTGKVGHLYGATNTPHVYVIDERGVLVYAGAIDNSPDGEGESPTDGKLVNYVTAALEDLDAKRPLRTPSTRAYGCTVKY